VTLSSSTILNDFTSAVDELVNTELRKLDTAKADVEDAIAVDQDKDIAVKRDIKVLLEDAKKVDDSVKPFVDKLDEAEKIEVTSPSFNVLLGALLAKAITTLQPFGRAVETIKSRFEQMNQTMNESYKSSDNYLTLKETIDGLNELYTAQQSKYNELNAKYTSYKPPPAPPPGPRPSSARRPTPAAAAAAASSSSANSAKSISPNQSPRQLPQPSLKDSTVKKNAWESRLPSLSPPRIELNEMEHMKTSASPESIAVGPMEHYVFIPRNQKGTPPVAYLLEIPADAGDMSPKSVDGGEFGGGSKRKHLQTGGAPLPDVLPPNSEIRVIDTQTPGMFEFYTGLTPPDVLLHDSSEQISIHPIIEKIRNRMPIDSQADKTIIYNQIRPYLITKDSSNPLVIGRKAVYKVNILKLLRLLDKELDTGDKYRVTYQNLSAFMEYDGTFGILNSLFNATFNAVTKQLRSKGPLPSITDVFTKHDIMKIVGWENKNKNVLFDNLFNMFLKQCKSTGKNSEFLSNINNLGSNPNLYYRFRLNWIILLAFHSLYIRTSTLQNVGWLIDKMHEAFLGWMSRERDIFKLMFTPADHNPKNSQTNYSDKVNGIINRDINRHSLLVSTLNTIKDKLCDLEENKADLPIEDVKPDEDDDDPDYEPSDDSGSEIGSEIGSGSGMTSSRDSLSSANLSYKDVVQGGPTLRQGRKLLRPGLPIPTDIEISKNPRVAKLNLKPLLTPGVNQSQVSNDWITQSAAAVKPSHLQLSTRGPESGSNSDSSEFLDVLGNHAREGDVVRSSTSQPFRHSARSISGTGRDAWSGPSPSTKNRHATKSNSPPSNNPSPPPTEKPSTPQNETLFIRRQQIPELDFGKVSKFDSTRSTQLLNRLQQDARRPNTARPRQSQQIQPFSSGSLSARTQSALERPAMVAPFDTNRFKRNIKNGNILPSSSSITSDIGPGKPVPPSTERVQGVISPRETRENKSRRVSPGQRQRQGQGGNRKYTRKRNDKKVYNKPKKTRRRNIQPISSNKNKHTRKRPRT